MQTKRYALLFCWMFYSILTLAQSDLYVLDPRRGNWSRQKGSIDDATLVIRPNGIYAQIDMYLTFSAKGTNFQPTDTLEVVLDFNLPKHSIVTDSWLWIEDDIIKAAILDRWTASTIYENIVGRRQDPSILFKNGENAYQLRIFPLAANKSRKVKISYLVPTEWSRSFVNVPLPLDLLRSSAVPLLETYVRTLESDIWKNPRIAGVSGLYFEESEPGEYSGYKRSVLQYNDLLKNPYFAVDAPLNGKEVFLSTYDSDEGGIYQLVVFPKELVNEQKPKGEKILVLVDSEASGGEAYLPTELLSQIKQNLYKNLTANDSFNIVYSQLNTRTYSDDWMPGDSITIRDVFNNFGYQQIPVYSNMPALLGEAVEFIQKNGKNGKVLIFANSSQIYNWSNANQLLNLLQTQIGTDDIAFSVFDFVHPTHAPSVWANNRYFVGNEYFYINLTRSTGGDFVTAFDRDFNTYTFNFKNNLPEFFDAILVEDGYLDLHTRLENGFCHSRYTVGNSGEVTNFRKPILQVGKLEGTFPFIVEVAGIYNDQSFSKRFVVEQADAYVADTLAQEIWIGNYIQALENAAPSNQKIAEIIAESMEERVLSLYTAFMCLEPSQGGEPCFDCVDESDGTVVVDVDEVSLDNLLDVQAAPNPFVHQVKLVLEWKEAQSLQDYQFAIFNMVGQQVKVFNDLQQLTTDRVELTWETDEDIAPGIYFFVMQSPRGRYTLKLVKI